MRAYCGVGDDRVTFLRKRVGLCHDPDQLLHLSKPASMRQRVGQSLGGHEPSGRVGHPIEKTIALIIELDGPFEASKHIADEWSDERFAARRSQWPRSDSLCKLLDVKKARLGQQIRFE